MSVVENIFLATDLGPREVVDGWLGSLLELESIPDGEDTENEIGLRSRGSSPEEWLIVVVSRNSYAEIDPEPDEVQAFDNYPIEVAIRRWPKNEQASTDVARKIFEKLVESRPEMPMLLVHDLDLLVGAHLPGGGTKYWPEPPTVDPQDQTEWRPWITTADGR